MQAVRRRSWSWKMEVGARCAVLMHLRAAQRSLTTEWEVHYIVDNKSGLAWKVGVGLWACNSAAPASCSCSLHGQ